MARSKTTETDVQLKKVSRLLESLHGIKATLARTTNDVPYLKVGTGKRIVYFKSIGKYRVLSRIGKGESTKADFETPESAAAHAASFLPGPPHGH